MAESVAEGLRTAPYWLPEGARGYWERWAPEALAERTLTPATAAGFTELCRRAQYVAQLAAILDIMPAQASGFNTSETLAALSMYDRMAQKLEASLARFKLTAFGKPATSTEKPQTEANPFAALAVK